jgi:hypothetical protein
MINVDSKVKGISNMFGYQFSRDFDVSLTSGM